MKIFRYPISTMLRLQRVKIILSSQSLEEKCTEGARPTIMINNRSVSIEHLRYVFAPIQEIIINSEF